ncbi:MAG: methyltransferase domain-containing protein [Acidobacteriota bacterium]
MTREAPASLLASLAGVSFVCPRCHGELGADADSFRCGACSLRFPVIAGIPDFRLAPDPYLSVEEDLARTRKILEMPDGLSFRDLLRRYWGLSDETPAALREKFVETALTGEERARRTLSALAAADRARVRNVLEIGTGTGNLLATAAGFLSGGVHVIGTDAAMRWLHVARRRLRDSGEPEPALACCGGENLPFPDASFDAVVSIATLEFVSDAAAFLAECLRVLRPGGVVLVSAVNRFSVTREPHVALWGVGFLPRGWQAAYVRARRGASFEQIRLRSHGELRRLTRGPRLRVGGEVGTEFFLPDLSDEETRALSPSRALALSAYRLAKRFRAGRALLRRLAPEWVLVLRKKDPDRASR